MGVVVVGVLFATLQLDAEFGNLFLGKEDLSSEMRRTYCFLKLLKEAALKNDPGK